MKIEIDDIAFWMDAIRNSDDRYRTLESFWKGQLKSKTWLITQLEKISRSHVNAKIVIHGGWNGVLATMLFNSELGIKHITSVDIDPQVRETALTMNKRYEMEGKFAAVTADMTEYQYEADIVINTSCEHITQNQYDKWLQNVPDHATLALQSNNYIIDEHINCSRDLEDFIKKSKLANIKYKGVLELPKYERYLLIGDKHGQ